MLDGNQIRERRVDLGIPQVRLATRIGVTGAILADIEASGSLGEISIGQLSALADELGLSLWPNGVGSASNDASTLGELLGQAEFGEADRSDIAWALGWDARRTEEAVTALRAQLEMAGQSLVESRSEGFSIESRRSRESTKVLRRLASLKPEPESLDDIELILDVADCVGQKMSRLLKDYSAGDRRRVARLVKLGFFIVDADRVELSENARRALEPVLGRGGNVDLISRRAAPRKV